MAVTIASGLADRMRALAAASPDAEICGLLLGRDPGRIEAIRPAANVAATPGTRFEIDPAVLFAALREERGGGQRLLGHYHSHPSGRAEPSPRDAAAADGSGALWLIVAGDAIGAWRAVSGGAVHGAFVEVALRIEPPAVAQGGANRQKGSVLGQRKGS